MSNELSKREMSREEHDRLHGLLHTLCAHLPTDFEPCERSREEDWGPDCSCGCRHFLHLEWPLGADWGVWSNPKSTPAGRTSSGGRESTPRSSKDSTATNCSPAAPERKDSTGRP